MSASQKKPWLRFIKRDTLQGGGRGNVTTVTFRGEAAYVRRLRRIERVLLYLLDYRDVRKLTGRELDLMAEAMYSVGQEDGATASSGGEDAGDPLPIPHERAPEREASGEARAVLSAGDLPEGFLEDGSEP